METGNCYLAAFLCLRQLYESGEKGALLCHGLVCGANGETFGHAWIELGDGEDVFVIDRSNGGNVKTSRTSYYATLAIAQDSVVKYDHATAFAEYEKFDDSGPWVKRFVSP